MKTRTGLGIFLLVCLCMGTLITYGSCSQIAMGLSASSTYKVTYDGNGSTGGSVPADSTEYKKYSTVTVKPIESGLVKTGYTFSSWNTKADASGTTYKPYGSFTIESNVTLYAIWTADPVATTYTVTYNGNGNTGGSVPTDTNTYEYGENFIVKTPDSAMVKTGYIFTEWNTEADGTGYGFKGGENCTMDNGGMTLYATWVGTSLANVEISTIAFNTEGSGLTVSWGSVTNAVTYNLYRSTTSTGTFIKISAGLTRLAYSDTSITTTVANQTYYYKVGAVNNQGTEVLSSAKGVKIPKAVINFTSTAMTKLLVSFVPSGNSTGDTVYHSTLSSRATSGILFNPFDGPSGTYTIGWEYITTASGKTWTGAPADGKVYTIMPGKTYTIIFEMSGHTISSMTSEPLLTQL